MGFLSQACVDQGSISQSGVCCPGLTAWAYDANSGVAYDGFGCWNATYADVGQYAGPGGMDSGKCKPGLVAVSGKCAVPMATGGEGFAFPMTMVWIGVAALMALLLLKK